MNEKIVSPTKAIMTFFNTEGYEPLTAKELLELKRHSIEGYEELGNLALSAINN